MQVGKVRFIEPGNRPFQRSLKNLYTYERYIRNPSIGLLTLATIVHARVPDTFMYSESISQVVWEDVYDADVVFIGIFTFSAKRGYEIADQIKNNSKATVVMGGLHASLNYPEAVKHCDYVLLGEGEESILELLDTFAAQKKPDFSGLAYLEKENGGTQKLIFTGNRKPPHDIDIIPDRNLLYRYRKMAGHSTLWPQVHASRGCPHHCDYCAVVRHFGHKVRTRTPKNVIEDIKVSIAFHDKRLMPRFSKVCWFTDDNFFADRTWAISVLEAIIESGITYRFTIQARYDVGFDDEMLDLLKRAGFIELAVGIEFLDDEDFDAYHKASDHDGIVRAIRNIQAHGLNVRGLFIFGSKHHTEGIGKRVADFVKEYGISGVLLQSMYFIPGTPVYEESKDRLLHEDWSKYTGNVVHWPDKITPAKLQQEVSEARKSIYSRKNLLRKVIFGSWIEKVLAIGEHYWHKSIRQDLREEMKNLEQLPVYPTDCSIV